MRRTALLTTGLCAVLALTGVAGATGATTGWHRLAIASWAPVTPAGGTRAASEVPEVVGKVESVAGGVLDSGGRGMTLHYPGADYVKVHFNRLGLPAGDRLTVADASGQESRTYTEKDLQATDDWATSVSGDTAVVTMAVAKTDALGLRSRLATLGVSVDKVARGLTPQEKAAADAKAAKPSGGKMGGGQEESICGRSDQKLDAACYRSSDPVAYAHSKPVARLLIDGIELCTAWRVGPNNRMFTNHHCLSQTQDVRRTEVWFNYECARCGSFETLRPTKVWGDRLLATDSTLDYTLFSVQNFDELGQFGFLTLDVRQPGRGEELYIPQHPRGDPTAIAMEDPGERSGNCAVANPNYDGYDYGTDVSYYCDTEGGSSGSPVISRKTNEVIALHHFGGCPNSGVRIDLIYREIANLL